MSYTENLSERWELVAVIEPPASTYNAEQNSGLVDVGKYSRLAIDVFAYDGGAATLDIDHEQATASDGTPKTIDTNAFDVTMAADEHARRFEIPLENFDVTNRYSFYNLEITPSGARNFCAAIYGLVRQAPASTALWDGVTGV